MRALEQISIFQFEDLSFAVERIDFPLCNKLLREAMTEEGTSLDEVARYGRVISLVGGLRRALDGLSGES